jgi:hypothetical protein
MGRENIRHGQTAPKRNKAIPIPIHYVFEMLGAGLLLLFTTVSSTDTAAIA